LILNAIDRARERDRYKENITGVRLPVKGKRQAFVRRVALA
jgi:hypothetical protein